jgi:hypothetical protein
MALDHGSRSRSVSPPPVFLLFFCWSSPGSFSIWRLSNFSRLSADRPKCGCLIRAPSATSTTSPPISAPRGATSSTDPTELAETERQMAELDRSIAEAERNFLSASDAMPPNVVRGVAALERIPDWSTRSRACVEPQSRAQALHGGASRAAYEAASDTLGQLTDQAVASAQAPASAQGCLPAGFGWSCSASSSLASWSWPRSSTSGVRSQRRFVAWRWDAAARGEQYRHRYS